MFPRPDASAGAYVFFDCQFKFRAFKENGPQRHLGIIYIRSNLGKVLDTLVQGAGSSEYRAFCESRERTSSDEFSGTRSDIGDKTPTPPTLCLWLNGFVVRQL